MASTIPRPAAPPHAAASAAASVFVAKPAVQAANVIRFQVVKERLELYFKGEIPYQAPEFANAVFSLAKYFPHCPNCFLSFFNFVFAFVGEGLVDDV